eukprot:6925058-Alexandrium_andersonii.AAC.1
MRTPVQHIHSTQHSKTWLLDRAVHCVGSANGTENSLTRCHEVVLWTKSRDICEEAAADFEAVWNGAEAVTDDVLARARERRERANARRSPS